MLKKADRHEEALTQFEAMLAMDTTNARLHVEIGLTASELKRYKKAEYHLRHALSQNARNARARYGLGATYALQGHWVRAQKQCDSLKTVSPALHKKLQRLINP